MTMSSDSLMMSSFTQAQTNLKDDPLVLDQKRRRTDVEDIMDNPKKCYQ